MYLFHFLQVLQVFMLVDQRFYVIHECDTIQLYDKGIYIYIYRERERERDFSSAKYFDFVHSV